MFMCAYLESLRAFRGRIKRRRGERKRGRGRGGGREREREKTRRVSMAIAHVHTHHYYISSCSSQLLLYLKEFSQKMSTKTHEIEKQVDTLVHEAKVSDDKLNAFDNGGWAC